MDAKAKFTPDRILKERERHREKSRKYRYLGIIYESKKPKIRIPHQKAATTKVNNAIKSGKIKKMPCEICGKEKVQGHHEDYDKPLDVNWLCIRHHNDRHIYLGDMAIIKEKPLPIKDWEEKMKNS